MKLTDEDYQAWGLRSYFTVTEASFLWFGLHPQFVEEGNWIVEDTTLPPGAWKNASIIYHRLIEAIYGYEVGVLEILCLSSIYNSDIPEHLNKEAFRLRERDARSHGIESSTFMQTSHRQEELECQEAGLETTDEAIRRLWKEGQAFLVPVLYENCENLKVPRDELIKFAKNLKQAPRFLFGDTRDELFRLRDEVDKLSAENEQLKSTSSCYMNQDHPQYAPKLHAAVLFWEEHFRGSGYGPSNVKNAFQVWYQNTWVKPLSGDKFTSTSQDNIAKVATPRNRKGGRGKNSE